MSDYESLGLNSFLNSVNSLSNSAPKVQGINFDYLYEVQNKAIKSSVLNAGQIALVSAVSTGTADFSAGSALNLTSTLTYNIPNQAKPIFGNLYVTIYQGTTLSAANEIYPLRGSGVTLGRYNTQGWYDLRAWDNISSVWRALLVDTTGTSTQVISLQTQWQYFDYRSGTVT